MYVHTYLYVVIYFKIDGGFVYDNTHVNSIEFLAIMRLQLFSYLLYMYIYVFTMHISCRYNA